jgi:hypothetical protein
MPFEMNLYQSDMNDVAIQAFFGAYYLSSC